MSQQIVVFNHSPNLLKLFKDNLDRRGYEVFAYEQENIDLNNLNHLNPDLLIMGNLNSFNSREMAFLQQFKTYSQFRSVPIIICTTAPYFNLDGLTALPDVTILTKPFDLRTLLECVKTILKLH